MEHRCLARGQALLPLRLPQLVCFWLKDILAQLDKKTFFLHHPLASLRNENRVSNVMDLSNILIDDGHYTAYLLSLTFNGFYHRFNVRRHG